MRKLTSLVSTGILAACAASLWADSYAPYPDNVQVESTGRFYVVVKVLPGGPGDPGRGTPVEVSIAERKKDSPPVLAARTAPKAAALPEQDEPEIAVREGGTLHGRVRLGRVPRQIVISSTGLGFVGLDVNGYNFAWPGQRKRTDDAVVYVGPDGTVKFRKDTLDLFDDHEMGQFRAITAGGVWWCGGGWFDEKRKQFVIVGNAMQSTPKQRFFRILDLETGELSKGSADLVVTALKDANPGALTLALDLAAELELKEVQPYLGRILWSTDFPPEGRAKSM